MRGEEENPSYFSFCCTRRISFWKYYHGTIHVFQRFSIKWTLSKEILAHLRVKQKEKKLKHFLDTLPPFANFLIPAYFIWGQVKFHSWTLHKYSSKRGLNCFGTLITKAVSTIHHCCFQDEIIFFRVILMIHDTMTLFYDMIFSGPYSGECETRKISLMAASAFHPS